MAVNKDLRINENIKMREVRLIDEAGEQLGVVPTKEALQKAIDAGLDLVEVSPNAKPPVCKIIDYGKYKFEQEKKLRESKKKQTVIKNKEVRMQPKIETHDLEFKTKMIAKFLKEGNKVKVTVRFRGRELAHKELGRDLLNKILTKLDDSETAYNLDKKITMEGKMMSMILSQKAKK
ncbi:MAG: translation initiation factor IF-3 [Spirochaetales bacterium]|nr:translation initiation factor IF-3 [Spirochaetales bacterium]